MKANDGCAAVALVAILLLFSSGTAAAAAMDCGSQHKVCLANCSQPNNRQGVPVCVKECHARQLFCMRTGCWSEGASHYCGLLKR